MTRAFILLFLLPCCCFGQFTITGKVLNRDDSRPLANVNVFLNNATTGSKTAIDGAFKLAGVKPGKYDLIVSIVGFSTYRVSVFMIKANVDLPLIYLDPAVIGLKEIVIKAGEEQERETYLDLFKDQFIGTSGLAKECKIVNPEVLDLSYNKQNKMLTAKSADFLVIENNALGYRVKYLLTDFTLNNNEGVRQFFYEGFVSFEELKGTPLQEAQWKLNRQEAYSNSIVHFLRAALNNKFREDGFKAFRLLSNPLRPTDSLINARIKLYTYLKKDRRYRDSLLHWEKKLDLPKLLTNQNPQQLTEADIISAAKKRGLYTLSCGNDPLYVIYDKSRQFHSTSPGSINNQNNSSATLITFNAPCAFFDDNGAITNSGCLMYAGAWANKRIAELLPVNYVPQQTEKLADSTLVKKLNNKLQAYTTVDPEEKAYLHFDKPYYAAGDTIYFKAYVTDRENKLSDLSGTLNVELINPDNKVSGAVKLKLTDGMAAGDFTLADTLLNGMYRLRAYTNLMRKAGEAYFFDQYLLVANSPPKPIPGKKAPIKVNTTVVKLSPSTTPANKTDLQFFPEGGQLVNGVVCKVAFKATKPDGLGAAINGIITDEQGKKVCSFSSRHLGMGTFVLTPVSGHTYKASVTGSNGEISTFSLPVPDDAGCALSVDDTAPRMITVNVTSGTQNQNRLIGLAGQAQGKIYFYTQGKLVNNRFTVEIPKNTFPEGIVQFTLFSGSGEPLNERLVFIKNFGLLNMNLGSEKATYSPRGKVRVSLVAKNQDDNPATGYFSVSVTNETNVPVDEENESTILSHLLLTSDLRGYVERPNYYFMTGNDRAASDLDILMLTQGYHRFEWKEVLNKEIKPEVVDSGKFISVSGKITTTGGKPIAKGKVSLLSVTNVFFSKDTVADNSGRFVFNYLPGLDSMRYIIQATNPQVRKNSLIEIDQLKLPKISGNKNAPDGSAKPDDELTAFLTGSGNFHREQLKQGIVKQGIILKEVSIREKKEQKYLRNSSNLNGPGNADQVITADQIPLGCPTFLSCIQGYLRGIKFALGNFYYNFFPTLVLLDGVEIPGNLIFSNGQMMKNKYASSSQADILNSLVPSDIASIEIIRNASLAAIYGVRGAGGVIIITTKRWDDVTEPVKNTKRNFANYAPTGYYKAKVFYSPKYDVPASNLTAPDLRTTIYWNPNVTTGEDGKASIEYFNADTKGTYRVVLEGIDDNGNMGRTTYRYVVK